MPAEVERIDLSRVRLVVQLTLLAPDIVEAILGGWVDQRVMLEKLERPLAVQAGILGDLPRRPLQRLSHDLDPDPLIVVGGMSHGHVSAQRTGGSGEHPRRR